MQQVYDPKSKLSAQAQFNAYRKANKRAPFALHKGQLMMIEDGAPFGCFITDDERKQAWIDNPPKPMAPWVDPKIEEQRKQREEEKRQKTAERIERLKATATPRARKTPERPDDTFTLRELADELKLDPRDVRAAARTIKERITELQVFPNMKYVFWNRVKLNVEQAIRQALEARGERRTSRGERKRKAKGPTPGTYAHTLASLIAAGYSERNAEREARKQHPVTSSGKAIVTRSASTFTPPTHTNIIEKKEQEKHAWTKDATPAKSATKTTRSKSAKAPRSKGTAISSSSKTAKRAKSTGAARSKSKIIKRRK